MRGWNADQSNGQISKDVRAGELQERVAEITRAPPRVTTVEDPLDLLEQSLQAVNADFSALVKRLRRRLSPCRAGQ